jgi:hypothetical protein
MKNGGKSVPVGRIPHSILLNLDGSNALSYGRLWRRDRKAPDRTAVVAFLDSLSWCVSRGVGSLSRLQKLSFLFFVGSLATSAPGYSIGGAAWPGSPVTLNYSYVNMFDGGLKMPDGNPLSNQLIRGSIEESLRLWSSVAPLNFVEVVDDGLPHTNQFRFRHIYINGPDPPPPASPVAKAQATCIGNGFACEIQFDNSDRWQEMGTLPNPDVLGASIHEVGHILGLHHTSIAGENMYWIFHRFQGLGTGQLFPDDIAGIQAIYGAGSGTVTPLVPEPASLLLLWVVATGWLLRRPAQ